MLEEAKHTYWVDGQNQIPLQTHNNTYIHIQQFEYSISAFKIENYFSRCLYPKSRLVCGLDHVNHMICPLYVIYTFENEIILLFLLKLVNLDSLFCQKVILFEIRMNFRF